jgi:arginyl-tRNA synthetase
VERAVERLREHGHVYEEDGALWFRSTAFGDDKDRVIYRSDGRPTYFAADIGYVTEKFSRGFDHLIYVWGADHHGTVARLRNAAGAMGYDREAVQVLLYAWVRFLRAWTPEDGEGDHVVEVGGRRMVVLSNSKRSGDFVTLDDLVAEVGVDAARWFFASRSATTAIDFEPERMRHIRELVAQRAGRERDRDHADQEKLEGIDLGVYNVQYAHARVASILRKGAEQGLTPATTVGGSLASGPERALASVIVRLPEVLEDAVLAEETHGITAYAMELASALHEFYRDARVLDPDTPDQTAVRLALVSAARITLARTLGLLGISAPESM